MRRTAICVIIAMMMYALYLYTLPAPAAPDAALASVEPQVTSRIDIPAKALYAVCLGVYDTEEEARPDAAAYSLRGAAGYIVEINDGWAILGSGYATESEANSVCSQLRRDENIPAQVIKFTSSELSMSVSATPTQTEALRAALAALATIPAELMELSAQVDNGQCDINTARTLVSLKRTSAQKTQQKLTQTLGSTADIFARLIETELMELNDALALISSNDGPRGLTLSSFLKQSALETDLGLINLANTLGAR